MSNFARVGLLALLLATSVSGQGRTPAISCDAMASLALPNARVTSAKSVDGVCRVAATLTPSADSDIKIEVWLPESGWNGKLQSVGNGGWAGTISYGPLGTAVKAGYAAASTDTGHSTPGASGIRRQRFRSRSLMAVP